MNQKEQTFFFKHNVKKNFFFCYFFVQTHLFVLFKHVFVLFKKFLFFLKMLLFFLNMFLFFLKMFLFFLIFWKDKPFFVFQWNGQTSFWNELFADNTCLTKKKETTYSTNGKNLKNASHKMLEIHENTVFHAKML